MSVSRNIKILIASLSMLVSGGVLYAATQKNEPEVREQSDRRVEVSREYVPEMRPASKLSIKPDLMDTMRLRPEFDYMIQPNAWSTGFGVVAINPAQISAADYDPLFPFYLKVGGGAPAQSIFDFYAGTSISSKGSIGGFLTHYGQYGKIKNDLGNKERGLQSQNSAGLFGQLNLGQKAALKAEFGVDYDIWSRYGAWMYEQADMLKTSSKSPLQSYTKPYGKITVGNDFSDLSFLNYRIGIEAYYLVDRDDNKEKGIDASFGLGKKFGVHIISLAGGFRGVFGDEDMSGYYDRILSISPSYGIVTDKFRLNAGVEFAYNTTSQKSSKLYFMPQGEISYQAASWFMPYIKLDSRIINNSYGSLIRRNPYLDPSLTKYNITPPEMTDGALLNTTHKFHNTREYNLRGGIAGSISTNFNYQLFAGLSMHRNPLFFYYVNAIEQGVDNEFKYASFNTIRSKRMTTFLLGAELEGRVSNSFNITLSAHYYDYTVKAFDEVEWNLGRGINTEESKAYLPSKTAFGLPEFDAKLGVRYNYRSKFFATLSGELIGSRNHLEVTASIPDTYNPVVRGVEFDTNNAFINVRETKQSATFDLSLELEYRVKRGFGIFVQANNLINSKLYRFNHYPDQGISVNGGIKLMF